MKLAGKVAIITGGGRNIGEETAKLFAREGAKVAVVDIDENRGREVAEAIKATHGVAEAFVADVSDPDQVDQLVKDVTSKLGRVDILVNNVAITDNKKIFDITFEEWNKVMAVTLASPFLLGRAAAKQMIEQEIESDFIAALHGIKKLPTSSRGGVYLAYVYYNSLFKKIKNAAPQKILTERIRISNSEKFGLMLNSMFQHKLNLL